jgi:hypothetical protein
MNTDLHELIQRYMSGTSTDEEVLHLQERLKQDPGLRDLYLSYANLDVALEAQASCQDSLRRMLLSPVPGGEKLPGRRFSMKQVAAVAAGLLAGLFSASLLFAYASPQAVVTASRLLSLVDGSFEAKADRVGSGFPAEFGVWSGDEARVVEGNAKDGGRALRFERTQGDAAVAQGPADSCDVFQIVDLRSLGGRSEGAGDSVLELSADFRDARGDAGVPVRFSCHLYLFSGKPEFLQASWPSVLREALGSGVDGCVVQGGVGAGDWRRVTARCVVPAGADFAVVQVACGRVRVAGAQVPELGSQFADNVNLTLKIQPKLPVRRLER